MSKTLLLTSASVVVFTVAIYAKVENSAEKETLYGSTTHAFMHDIDPKQVDLSSQVMSQKPNLDKSAIADVLKSGFVLNKVVDKTVTKDLFASAIMVEEDVEQNDPRKATSAHTPSLAGFTIDRTIEYAKLAQLAYIDVGNPESDKFDIIEKMQKAGDRVQFFGTEVENSGLIITHADGRVSVIYKGTNSLNNLATDVWANFAIDDITGLRCHNGIMKGFYRTKDQVFAILEQIAATRGKSIQQFLQDDVTVGGHSLGGGLSQIFMGYAYKIHGALAKAVTFATPRVFDVATAKAFDEVFHDKYLNVLQVTDPVPTIAFGVLGYGHFGSKLEIPFSTLHWQHTMGGYLKALEAIAQVEKVQVGARSFRFEEKNTNGIGKSKWIGNTSIPNPIYPIHAARMAMAEHVDPVIHKGLKAVKDGAIKVVGTIADTAKMAGEAVATTAGKVVDGIRNAAKNAWNYLWS